MKGNSIEAPQARCTDERGAGRRSRADRLRLGRQQRGGSTTEESSSASVSGTLNGEGSSAQKNAIEEVISTFGDANPDATVNYNATGSGDGVKNFIAKQVDFAGSDSALKSEAVDGVVEADAAKERCGGNEAWNLPWWPAPSRSPTTCRASTS